MLEASEPPQLGALVTQCHNELTVAQDPNADITPLPWHQRLLKNWLDFDQSGIDRQTPQEAATQSATNAQTTLP
jgi:hypothetical protein